MNGCILAKRPLVGFVVSVLLVGCASNTTPSSSSSTATAASSGAVAAPTSAPTPAQPTSPTPSETSVVGPRAASWTATGSMVTPREGHTATLLPDGKVLVAGGLSTTSVNPNGTLLASAELYDPGSGTWTATGNMRTARMSHTATLLPDGSVLVAGGAGNARMAGGSRAFLTSAELYDPATGTWTTTGRMVKPRGGAVATLLPNGKVLVVGGAVSYKDGYIVDPDSAELYDPARGTWTATRKMVFGGGAVARLLPDGKVLAAGGQGPGDLAQLYDPSSGTWTATGKMVYVGGGMATLLPDGKVLMACGCDHAGRASELYDPATGSWTATGTMVADHWRDTASWLPDGTVTATLLADGEVLVAGGGSPTLPAAELYDPGTGRWTATAKMLGVRVNHTATLLADGKVLVAGGEGDPFHTLGSAELYDSKSGVFTATGSLADPRTFQAAAVLADERVPLTGGHGAVAPLASAETYDPNTGTSSSAGRGG